ncbi:hypothetical protein [Ornithinibacillus bavariensis]|uniref:Uncharacterized protein n=1 Tax=Ornithinibacillus bavariensis TaxID=545502 RepID=A0A920C5N4_9BACI|nr:hypothetical protein [Ornithinibacillus bavariensis]GIO26920.1 hypothetical protein J43TS3_15310 [Ornithinibacillus bavariensis]
MEKELEAYKRELLYQLEVRERELQELHYLRKEYDKLQKQYHAISSSKLGKITFKYWEFRNKLKGMKNR